MGSLADHKNAALAGTGSIADREITYWADGGGGSGGAPKDWDRKIRTSANITVTTTGAFQDVDNALDIVLDAVAGDLIEYGVCFRWSNQAAEGYADVATVVGGARVNRISGITASEGTSLGAQCWMGDSSARANIGGSLIYQLVAGDIENATVRLRLISRASANKDIIALATAPLVVWAKNLGQ